MKMMAGQDRNPDCPTVFHITHYKAGSQWVYGFLKCIAPERVVTPLAAAAHVTSETILRGAIYPTVYLRRNDLERIHVPGKQCRFIVCRDLRDTLISFYCSLRYSHSDQFEDVKQARQELTLLDERSGIYRVMERDLCWVAQIQRSWLGQPIPTFRYESLIEDQFGGFEAIAAACEISASRARIRKCVKAVSFARRSGRKLGIEQRSSHLRKGVPGDWRNYFDAELKSRFKELYGDLLIESGYESSHDW